MGVPYIRTETEFRERLQEEIETGVIKLRRLYPDVPKFRSLLNCLAPYRITKIEEFDGIWTVRAENDGSSAKEFEERNSAWQSLLEECGGKALNLAIFEHLNAKGVDTQSEIQVNRMIQHELINFHRNKRDELLQMANAFTMLLN